MRKSTLWLGVAGLVALGAVAMGCQPGITVAQTSTPGAASPAATAAATATATATPEAAVTSRIRQAATPEAAATSTRAEAGAAATGDVCNPCTVMRIDSVSGKIDAEVAALGKEGAIEVLAFHHEVKAPRDAATGQATGRRQHHPFTFVKTLDKATPMLMHALVNGTKLTVWIEMYRTTDSGALEKYYTIKLEDVMVESQSVFGFEPQPIAAEAQRRTWVIPHVLEKEGSVVEEVTFTYQKITQTSETGKTTASDSWSE